MRKDTSDCKLGSALEYLLAYARHTRVPVCFCKLVTTIQALDSFTFGVVKRLFPRRNTIFVVFITIVVFFNLVTGAVSVVKLRMLSARRSVRGARDRLQDICKPKKSVVQSPLGNSGEQKVIVLFWKTCSVHLQKCTWYRGNRVKARLF